MRNKRMEEKLEKDECMDVEYIGKAVEGSIGLYEIQPEWVEIIEHPEKYGYPNGLDLCVKSKEQWIWSVGIRYSDKKCFASTSADLYENAEYRCIWLR